MDEEEYELNAAMLEVQKSFSNLRSAHNEYVILFRSELSKIISAADNLLPEKDPEGLIQGPLFISILEARATWNEKPVPLTSTQLKITMTMASRPHHVYSRDYLLDAFLTPDSDDRLVDSHIKRIRKAFRKIRSKL